MAGSCVEALSRFYRGVYFVAVSHSAAECNCCVIVVDLTSLDGGPYVDLKQWLL
jgi:hypothetical protein